ncbi:MAG TPA: hypothetical protein VIK33_16005 [Anaerolineae bacterium]
MFGIRYTAVRPILAVLTFAFLASAVFLAQNTGGTVALLALTVATFLSWINPPGIYGWLMQGTCAQCGGHVVWEIDQAPQPYYEIIRWRCENCERSGIDFSYQPQ